MAATGSENPDVPAPVPSEIDSNQNVETDKARPKLDIEMDIDSLYKAAVEGKIDPFKKYEKTLDQLVTPNKNTILHIYITALSKMENRSNLWRFFSRTTPPADRLKFVEEILKMCPDLLRQDNNNKETLLHIAARHGHVDMVDFLLKKRKEIHHDDQEKGVGAPRQMLKMKNKAEDTALHEAVRFNHQDVVQRLIKEDRTCIYDCNNAGESPLYMAAERGYRKIVFTIGISLQFGSPLDALLGRSVGRPFLLQSVYGGPEGRTALHAAVIRNDFGSTLIILYVNEHLTRTRDKQGRIPLHYAADYGYIRIVRLLLDIDDESAPYITHNKRKTAYITDNGKKTALHIAASRGNVDIMKMLISRFPGCSELVDERDWNVLHFAVESGNSKAIKLVLDNPSLSNLINKYNNDGNTPLHQLAVLGFYMPSFIGHPKVDKLAFNKQNLNALDITLGKDRLFGEQKYLKYCLAWNGIREGRRIVVNKNERNREGKNNEGDKVVIFKEGKNKDKDIIPSKEKKDGDLIFYIKERKNMDGDIIANIKEAREPHLVVATLIATVTFAAGFTVPGGYKGESSPDEGTAILTRSAAFKAFVITDTLALMLSSSAVFLHLFMAMDRVEGRIISQFLNELQFTIFAMFFMVGAFISGTYAVLAPSSSLAISACVLGCSFVLFYWRLIFTYIFNLLDLLSEKIKGIRPQSYKVELDKKLKQSDVGSFKSEENESKPM